ncbi:MAG: hypothetical protein WBY97_00580 [Roseiarcus sp.]
MEEPRPKKIEWVLVDDPLGCAGLFPQVRHARQRGSTEELAVDPHPRGFDLRTRPTPELDLAGAINQGMGGNDLFDQRGAGARHAENQDGCGVKVPRGPVALDELSRKKSNDLVNPLFEGCDISWPGAPADICGGVESLHRLLIPPEIIQHLAEGELEPNSSGWIAWGFGRGGAKSFYDIVIFGRVFPASDEVIVEIRRASWLSKGTLEKVRGLLESALVR